MNVEMILKLKGGAVATIGPEATLVEAARALTERRIGALVVSRDGQAIDGILSERDIVRAVADRGPGALSQRVVEFMSPDVITCSRGDSIERIMAVMTQSRIRHIPVVEDGALAGIVSIGDVVKYRIDEIEMEANALKDFIAGR